MALSDTNKPRFVAYYRVSTEKQGKSGLGLEAQRADVACFIATHGGEIIAPEFVEVESGRKDETERPQLAAALERCSVTGAALLIAKLDRLSRDVHFLTGLQKAGVEFVCADNPHANKFTVQLFAVIAEQEREAISTRTKAALKAAKARGTKLGGFRAGAPDISQYQAKALEGKQLAATQRLRHRAAYLQRLKAEGLSLQAIARRLNDDHIQSPRGGQWTATAVKRALARLGGSKACAIVTQARSRMVEAVAI